MREQYPCLTLAQALYVAIRSYRDRQQHTVSTARHRVGSRSRQPRRDPDSDQIKAVILPREPSYERWIERD